MNRLKIPLEQIGYLQDDYQPAGYERSSTSIRRKSTKKASVVPSAYNGDAGAYGGGGGGEEEDESQVEPGFDDDDEYDDHGNEYECECGVHYLEQDVCICFMRMSATGFTATSLGPHYRQYKEATSLLYYSSHPRCMVASLQCHWLLWPRANKQVSLSSFSPDVGQCRVLYEYVANEADELSVNPDDIINIIDKYDAEWWQGELNGKVGIFPATYVEDIAT